jgi:hypothetical protein
MNLPKVVHVRVSRHAQRDGKDIRLITCWPVDKAVEKIFHDNDVREIQFDGDPKKFSIGSELKGSYVIIKQRDLQSYDDEAKLIPRFKKGEDGEPIAKNGKDVVWQGISIRWDKGTQFARVAQAEEVVTDVEAIA